MIVDEKLGGPLLSVTAPLLRQQSSKSQLSPTSERVSHWPKHCYSVAGGEFPTIQAEDGL